jgi:hypothetical protein
MIKIFKTKNYIMKKLLLGSVFLTIFAFAIMIFQISCQKDAIAAKDSSSVSTQQNKIVFLKWVTSPNHREIWTANYDGSDQKKLNIALLPGADPINICISPDYQYLFIVTMIPAGNTNIYSCKMDGSNVTKIFEESGLSTQQGVSDIIAY